MSEQPKLGRFSNTSDQRDAVHVAIVPVIAGGPLLSGDRVDLVPGTTDTVVRSSGDGIGVIDPFLPRGMSAIVRGQRVWLLLPPGSITSLRHDWTHPAFETVTPIIAPPQKSWVDPYADGSLDDFCCGGADDLTTAVSPKVVVDARLWLMSHAIDLGMGYEDLMEAANIWIRTGRRYLCRGYDTPDEVYSANTEFWKNYEIVTGAQVEPEDKTPFFSCSC